MNQKFDYYYGREAEQFHFYRIPKILFTDQRFSEISVEAKVLYGLLLDRMSLSIKNQWIDDENRVYIYFKLEDVMEYMGIGKDKGVKLFAELDAEKGCGLIRRKKQGLGKPVIIYVMNFNSAETITDHKSQAECGALQTSEKPKSELPDGAEVLTSENSKSGLLENRSLNFCEPDSNKNKSNHTENNDIEDSDTYPIKSYPLRLQNDSIDAIRKRQSYREMICRNIDYECLKEHYSEELLQGIVDIMLDAVCSKKQYLVVSGEELPQAVVCSRLLKLRYEHIEYVLDCMKKNTTKVRCIKSYLLTALYNSLTTIEHYYRAEVNHDLYGE
ncbi:replication initiator protein A [Oscillospiraceae bacterium DSM 107454]|uniref:Replication initiator protein A n=1 Tax=Ructibacterium gallinarum TaxID=2779355 RepID=A0A9D5RAX2_9FIRM|nr:replication initiator protein A [Ructibacterium gallinarum]